MNNVVLKNIKNYFEVHEFVDPYTYERHGEDSWQFICPRLQANVLFMREALDRPFHANNYKWGGRFSQRGLRSNLTQIVKRKTELDKLYLSAHTMGKALDFDVEGMEAWEVRNWAAENAPAFPYKVRFENEMKGKQIGWVHIDVYDNPRNPKLYFFNV